MKETNRGGIVCAGHWVVDRIKIINDWPQKFEQCHILSESTSGGGAPLNVALDLANMELNIPIYGLGCIGDDTAGSTITELCHSHNINMDYLHQLSSQPSSYTDVMVVQATGERTLFHYGGANRHFSLDYAPIERLKHNNIELFYLGHLLVVEGLDAYDQQYGSVAARLLHQVQQTGVDTVVDVATENNDRYTQVVEPSLPYIDHLVINELEAERITGIKTRDQNHHILWEGVAKAASRLIEQGVNQNAVIHMPEGGYWLTADGYRYQHLALNIPPEFFQSTCGAGDAFCSGVMAGLYQNWNYQDCLKLAIASSACSITSKDNSAGIRPIPEMLRLANKWDPYSEKEYFRTNPYGDWIINDESSEIDSTITG